MSRTVYYKETFGDKQGNYGYMPEEIASVDLASENVVPSVIKKDEVVMGITGTYEPTDANLKPENIKNGVTIFGVTGTYTG